MTERHSTDTAAGPDDLSAVSNGEILAWLAQDAELQLAAKDLSATVSLLLGEREIALRIEDGRIEASEAGQKADVRIEGSASAWTRFLAAVPDPGLESLGSAGRHGITLQGDIAKHIAPYHFVFQRIAELLREMRHGEIAADVQATERFFAPTDNAVGRYVRVASGGQLARIYYEEAGCGEVPLLLLHTAGGDSRQWRFLLADPDLQRKYRLIAFDLPFHGRSLPPQGSRWWQTGYVTGREQLMDWTVAFAETIKLHRPVLMGCSLGGNLALDLAAERADRFRAFVALNGWHDMEPLRAFRNDRFRTPAISENLFLSLIYGATAPTAAKPYRQEVRWIYASNVKGVYAGDNDYFIHGHDLRRNGCKINAQVTPVYVLTGSYDGSVHFPGHNGEEVAKRIPGVVYRELKGLGHFAPSDDPMGFRAQIIPVLAQIEHRLQHGN